MLKNIQGAIFDLDGTLIDSMWIWEQIDVDYLSKIGHELPNNLKDEINHLSFQETANYFKNRFKIEDSVEEIQNTWHDMAYYHYNTNVTLKPGVMTFLKYLKENDIKVGLATSNSLELLTAALHSTGIEKYFDAITITDEVKKGKNNPDVYLLAAKKLGVDPTKCIVFEDILEAVNGAKLANMKVVAVHDKAAEYQREMLISTADKYIVDFSELI